MRFSVLFGTIEVFAVDRFVQNLGKLSSLYPSNLYDISMWYNIMILSGNLFLFVD